MHGVDHSLFIFYWSGRTEVAQYKHDLKRSTTSQKILDQLLDLMLLNNSLLLTKPAFIWSKVQQEHKFKYLTILNNRFLFSNVIYCDFKAECWASLLQSRDPSEIILIFWFAAQKHVLLLLLCWKQQSRIVPGFFDEYKVQKNSIYLK